MFGIIPMKISFAFPKCSITKFRRNLKKCQIDHDHPIHIQTAGINKFNSAKNGEISKKWEWEEKNHDGKKHLWLKWLGRFNETGVTPVSSYCGCEADAIEIEGLCFIFRSNCQLQYACCCCCCSLFYAQCKFCGTSRAICKFSARFFQKQILTIEKCLIKSKMRREHCAHISLYAPHIDIFRSNCTPSKKANKVWVWAREIEKKVNCSDENQRVCWCET